MNQNDIFKNVLFGVSVGDALGVPVEFRSRDFISRNPVMDMIGNGTYNLPPGTWSDDSSLTFCLAEALIHDFDLNVIANNFINWLYNNYWTPRGNVFDVGNTTRDSIFNLKKGIRPDIAGGFYEDENGNGSLMRILPLIFYTRDKSIEDRYLITKQVSSITHGHIRSVISCFYYLEFAIGLIQETNKFNVYNNLQTSIKSFLKIHEINPKEVGHFNRLLESNIAHLSEEDIKSSGYVVHTLEASIWCLLTTDNYKDATLKAVNLGLDTDTTGAVTGGLAGILYGFENIPISWVNRLARFSDIEDLALRCREAISDK